MGTTFKSLYPQILDSLKSDTLAEMTDHDIQLYLDNLIKRAVADFLFPRIDLSYGLESESDPDDLAFVNDITQKEINVLLTLIKRFWLEQQIDDEGKMEQRYFDASIKTHSQANMLVSLRQRYVDAMKECDVAQHNYSRSLNNKPTVGDIYNGD
jgi:uncharacterized protein YaaW (UPF0174 family)